ncbi:hypothetical protein K4K60_009273 [Colletotrichum sp. SAR11_57]|nr:hypothetical protein K4K60_009273 [Colletotrichum sp. SAR11_57]
MEFQPNDIIQDSVFFTVLSTDTVSVTVSIGGMSSKGVLRDLPDGGAGLYHGSAPFNGRTGDVRITVTRKSVTIADETGPAIKNDCHNSITGFDAWAGGGLTSRAPSAVDTPSLENEVCIRGTGANDFDVLCRTTCYWGYCPESACVCRATGAQIKLPPETPGEVHPAEGLNSNYIGLCNYACLYGACFSTYCGKDEYHLIEPTVEMPHLDRDCYRFTECVDLDNTQASSCREGYTRMSFDRASCSGNSGLPICCKNSALPMEYNTCNNKEVTLILDQGGGDGNLCSWWRKKSLCCTPEEAVFGNGVCPNPYCTILIGDCALDEWAEDDDTDEDTCDDHDELRRDEGALAEYDALSLLTLEDGSLLEKRAKRRRTYQAVIEDIIQNLIEIIIIARAYPGSGTLHSNTRGDPASDDIFELAPGCGNVDVIVKDRKTFTKKQISAAYDTEHNPDLQFMADFLHTLGTGELPDLSRTVNGFIDPNDIEYWWDAPFPFGTFPTQGTSRCINSINDFIMDFFGSQGNRKPLLLCERRLNQMKGRIFNREMRPVNDVVMAGLRDDALSGDTQAEETMFDNIARAIGVWNYLNHPDALPTVSTNRNNLIDGSGLIGRLVPAFARMRDILMEFDENWYNDAAERTRGWVDEMLDLILQDLDALSQAGRAPPNEFSIRARVARLLNRRGDIKPPKR